MRGTVDFGYKGPLGIGSISPYIRMSLITDGNYVHFGQTDRKNRPSSGSPLYPKSTV